MKSILSIIFLLASLIGFSQNPEWYTYNISNSGLPCNNVQAVTFDASGNKWIGTGCGLTKFDNFNWVTFNTTNSGLPNNIVTSIAIDKNGTKWIGTGSGLTKFDDTTWTTYNNANSGLPSDNITSLAIDTNGNKWIGTWLNGLTKFDGVNWVTYFPSSSISSIVVDANDIKWIGTNFGLVKFQDTTYTIFNTSNTGMPINSISTLGIDVDGPKWIGTSNGNGLFKFDDVNWTTVPECLSFIHALAVDSSNTLWVGSDTWVQNHYENIHVGYGLKKFDGANWSSFHKNDSGLSSDFVSTISVDAYNNKWIGYSDGFGLTAYREGGVILGVEKNLQQSNDLTLFPNPASDVVTISSNLQSIKKVCVFNMLGVKVLETAGIGIETQIDISSLLSGIYIVQVQTENGFATKRLMVGR